MKPLSALLAALSTATAFAASPAPPVQDEKAAAAYQQRTAKGDGDAALHLGNLLLQGKASAKKYGTPFDWYKKGCTLGSLPACHNAGISHQKGSNGATQSYSEAANYYLKAADGAFLHSLFNLAILHAESHITALDNREGLKWMLVAQRAAAQCPGKGICKLVLDDSHGYRAKLEARLSRQERREAMEMAMAWHPGKK